MFDDGQSANKIVIVFKESGKCLVDYYKIMESKNYDNYAENMLISYGNILICFVDNEELNSVTLCL